MGTKIEFGKNITLRTRGMISTRRLPSRSQITCISGRLWVTFDGDREDHLLMGGDWYLPPPGARGAIIYAVEPSVLVLLASERVTFRMLLARIFRGHYALRS